MRIIRFLLFFSEQKEKRILDLLKGIKRIFGVFFVPKMKGEKIEETGM